MRRNVLFPVLVVCSLLTPSALMAHHPVLAKFDNDSPLTLTGRVTEVDWANPHAHIFMNVENGESLTNWAIELESPTVLELNGWEAGTLQAGDIISVEGIAARDGSEQAWGYRVVSGERRLFAVDEDMLENRLDERAGGPTPRWPDGQPRLGPPPGETGYWTAPGLSALVESGTDVAMDDRGVLRDIEDAPRVAPFQPWAQDLYVLRQRTYLEDDPMFLYCMPPGGPRQFQMPYPFGVQFVEDRARDRVFILMGGGNSNWRLIYTDGREPAGQVSGNDDNPLFYGQSAGEWQDDTLVITTRNFNDSFWFSNGGLPHTGQLLLTERFSRPDLNTLRYEVTIDDRGAYTRPWTSSWTLQWMPGRELPEYFCQDNRP